MSEANKEGVGHSARVDEVPVGEDVFCVHMNYLDWSIFCAICQPLVAFCIQGNKPGDEILCEPIL